MERIYIDNPGITAKQLYIKALQGGIDTNRKAVNDFLSKKGENQIYQQRKPSDGETAPKDDNEFQMDLIDMSKSKSGIYKFILVVANVFTRKAYLKNLTSKQPDVVERGLKTILDKVGNIRVISSDTGREWGGKVAKLLANRNIVTRFKFPGEINALSVVDRLIQMIRLKLSKSLTTKGKAKWDSEVKKIEDSYNSSAHSHLMDASPSNVPDVVKYELFEQSAEAIKSNDERNKKQTEKLEATNKYRAPLPQKDFERGFEPKYSEIRTAVSTKAGLVTDSKGDTHQIKQVQVVKNDSSEVTAPDFRAARLRPNLQKFADALKPYLQRNGATSLTTIGKILNQENGFKETKANLTLLQFMKLFPMFKTTGKLSATKVELR